MCFEAQVNTNAVNTFPRAVNEAPVSKCGTKVLPQQFETWVQSLSPLSGGTKGDQYNSTQSVLNIPVIVHVIHTGQPVGVGFNIMQAQIYDQINIMNNDFNGLHADTNLIPSVFKPLKAGLKINFCLAVVDPSNTPLPEAGIDRIDAISKGWTSGPYTMTYADNTIKPQSIWDPSRYMNIWVGNLGQGLLGYATLPNPVSTGLQGLGPPFGTATDDGVFILHTAFGSIGTVIAPYDKGRTIIHEAAHWLGLRHIWGDAPCGNDFCDDTPTQNNFNTGCPGFPQISCSNGPNGAMFMNYMDYVDDACGLMFTPDQVYRMQLIMANSPFRASLLSSTVCNGPGTVDDVGVSNIISPTYSQVVCDTFINPSVTLHNYGTNLINTVTFTYNLDGAGTQTLNWVGSLAPNTSTTVIIPQINSIANGAHYFAINALDANAGVDTYTLNNYSFQPFTTYTYTVGASSTPTICPGGQTTLTATGGASVWTWYPGSISGATVTDGPTTTTIYTVNGTYSGCVKTATTAVQMTTCTSLPSRISNLIISIYPNPMKDELFIRANEDVKVTLYNAIGQIVKQEIISREGKMNATDIPNAVYFVHVKGHNETRILKVVKQ